MKTSLVGTIAKYNFDLRDPQEYYDNPSIVNYPMEQTEIPRWYLNMSSPDYHNKLIYRIDKAMPPIVQEVLERCGFVEWDPAIHGEE